jgi:hypothetical protein
MSLQSTTAVLYNGHLFRNELVARWAVFLDQLNTRWEYQKEEFILPYGGPCRPDFWLPLQQSWLEICSNLPEEDDLVRAADLSFSTRKWVYVVWGNMGEHSIYGFNLPFYEQGYDKRYVFTLAGEPEELIFAGPLRREDAYQFIGYSYSAQQPVMQKAETVLYHPRLLAAYETAQNAQFERSV